MVIEEVSKHMPADGTVTITNNTNITTFLTEEQTELLGSVCSRKSI